MTGKTKKSYKHILIPLCLAVYLGIMAYIGRDAMNIEGEQTSYILKIAVGIIAIVLLYFVLRKRERLRREREKDLSGK